MSSEVKAIAVDIDGTLTDRSRKVSCEAIEALRMQVDKGIIVMLVTGNILPIAYALSHYLGFHGPVIAENGGIVGRGTEIRHLSFKDEPLRAFEHLEKEMKVERIFTDRWRETEVAVGVEYDLEEIRRNLKDFDVKVVTTGWAHHILHKDTDKVKGLRFVCDNWLSITFNELAAIGDSDNDVNMIKSAGYGITLSNGSIQCKESADFIASKPHGSGIVEALEWLGLLP